MKGSTSKYTASTTNDAAPINSVNLVHLAAQMHVVASCLAHELSKSEVESIFSSADALIDLRMRQIKVENAKLSGPHDIYSEEDNLDTVILDLDVDEFTLPPVVRKSVRLDVNLDRLEIFVAA